MGALTATVTDILIYPIKSCCGISIRSTQTSPLGFDFDRRWMIVTESNGKFVTLRQEPKMWKIQPSMPDTVLAAGDSAKLPADAVMTVTTPGMTPLAIPLVMPSGSLKPCTIWEWSGSGLDQGDEAAAWFSAVIGQPCRLLRYVGSATPPAAAADGDAATPVTSRPTDPEFCSGGEVAFADGFPVLVATEESLADLNKHLEAAVPMARFRPNLVLSPGGPGWQEDSWATVSKPETGLAFKFVKPCDRCKVPTIDPETGKAQDEPLKTLNELRSGKALGWAEQHKSWAHSVFFGWNVVPSSRGELVIGDVLQVTAKA